ncbi:MAG: C25 family cysteine peptidase [Promethearchaeota archaeon]
MKIVKKTKNTILLIIFILSIVWCSYTFPIKSFVEKKNKNNILNEKEQISYDQNFLGDSEIKLLDWNEDRIELEYIVPELIVEEIIAPTKDLYHQLSISGGGHLEQAGHPKIPFRTLKILLPYGKELEDIEIVGEGKQTLEGTYRIEPGQAQTPLGLQTDSVFTLDTSIYDSDNPFPAELYSVVGVYKLRGYKILILNLYPVSYIPKTSKISYYEEMKVLVNLNECIEENSLFRGKKKDEERVIEIVDNPQLIETYLGRTGSLNRFDSLLALPPGSYNYTIITNEALKNSGGTYTFQDLVNSKNAKGIQTNIVTVEYIYNNYPGDDNQEKIRNFIIDAYSTWGIEYVLLGGDGDGENVGGESEDPIIPSRGFYVSWYNEYNIPSDLYYAGLDGTWDDDGDGLWGEPGEDDLYAEVYVGRAPVDSEAELSNFVMKTLLHEAAGDSYLFETLMVGEFLGWTRTGGDYKDEIRYGSDMHGYTTVGIPAEIYNVETLYDRDVPWDKSQLIALMNDGVHIINHLGHANVEYNMRLINDDVDSLLTNEKYFFAYSQGCYSGAFDNRNTALGYGKNDCIVEHFVTTQHGAFAFIGNSRYGWGNTLTTDGASQHYDREFYDAIYREDIIEIGRANQDSKEDNIAFLNPGNPMRYCYYELNLFGDPMATITITLPHDLRVSLEVPENPEIESTYVINATVTNKGENDENSVDFVLYLDDIDVASTTIPTLQVDESVTLNFDWTPIGYDTYNFTAYAMPVTNETCVKNNIKTQLVSNIINYKTLWFDDFESGLSKWESITGLWHLTNDSVSWPPPWDPYNSPIHSMWFGNASTGDIRNSSSLSLLAYSTGHFISIPIDLSSEENAYLEFYHWRNHLQPLRIQHLSYVYISTDNINWNPIYVNNDWIPTWEKVNLDISSYCGSSSVRIKFDFFARSRLEGMRGWFVDDIKITIPLPNYNKPSLSSGSVSPSTGNQTKQFNFSVNYVDQDNHAPLYINTVINGISYQMEKQDLSDNDYTDGCIYQSLTYLQPGDYNYFFECYDGFSCFTDVQWLSVAEKNNENSPILTNGQIDPISGFTATPFTFSVTYSDSDNNAPEYMMVTINTMSYSMIKQDPMDNNYMDGCIYIYTCKLEEGICTYSFTCTDGVNIVDLGPYLGPVVERGQLFDGMFIKYDSDIVGKKPGYSKFSYSYYSAQTFNVSWERMRGVGSWNVNTTTRIMSNPRAPTFGNGYHTPVWIFTDVSLGDNISIAVTFDGDHDFTISGELIYYIPGFGAVEVWVLEDLTTPGGIAWYEKSTGILLNGTFLKSDGSIYTFEFVDTNVIFTYLEFPPLNPSITINNGDVITNNTLVTLTLSAEGATEMCFRNGKTGDWTEWEPYSTTKQFYLEGHEHYTVYSIYVKFRNGTGETIAIGDNILYLEDMSVLPENPIELYMFLFIWRIILLYLLNN